MSLVVPRELLYYNNTCIYLNKSKFNCIYNNLLELYSRQMYDNLYFCASIITIHYKMLQDLV